MTAQVRYNSPVGGGEIPVGVVTGDSLVTSTAPTRIVFGVIALDGSNPTPITTGLTQIVGGGACLNATAAPGVATVQVTVNFTTPSGTLNLYAWKPTSNLDCTLIASTATENVSWWAFGY